MLSAIESLRELTRSLTPTKLVPGIQYLPVSPIPCRGSEKVGLIPDLVPDQGPLDSSSLSVSSIGVTARAREDSETEQGWDPGQLADPEETATLLAKDQVIWSLGEPVMEIRGGVNREGIRSVSLAQHRCLRWQSPQGKF